MPKTLNRKCNCAENTKKKTLYVNTHKVRTFPTCINSPEHNVDVFAKKASGEPLVKDSQILINTQRYITGELKTGLRQTFYPQPPLNENPVVPNVIAPQTECHNNENTDF